MKKSKICFFLLCLFISQGSILCQTKVDTSVYPTFKHSLGIGAGFTTAYGISYRFWPGRLGLQGTFAPYSDENISDYSIGISLLFKLVETEKVNLLLYQGNHYRYRKHKYDNSDDVKINSFNNGLGLGIEFIILKRVSFNLMGGYAGYENFKKIGFTGETGLYFKF